MARTCKGCEAVIKPHPRERNRRRWCSGACRLRYVRATRPEYVARQAELSTAHHRATYEPVRHSLTCCMCGETFVSPRAERKFCSTACKYRSDYIGRRGRKYGAEREPYTLREIGDRDDWWCCICGAEVDKAVRYPDSQSPSIDHIIPLSQGGSDKRDNVGVAHLICNKRKGNRAA